MATSQNGWSASPNLPLRSLVVAGIPFPPGIRDDDDVATVLGYVAAQFHQRVEKLVDPGCWGYNYRANANNPYSLSNHSSGTAIDVNAPQHPNGVPTSNTFTQPEIDEVHKILAEVGHTIRWGGDYSGTPDAMHFEVNVSKTTLAKTAEQLRKDDDMPLSDDDIEKIAKRVNQVLGDYTAKGEPRDPDNKNPKQGDARLRQIEKQTAKEGP